MSFVLFFFCLCYGDPRDRHVLTHPFPTRRSSDLINGLVFLLELVLGQRVGLLSPFMLWPLQPGAYDALSGTAFMPWQLITYGFLHDPNNFAHLLFNML